MGNYSEQTKICCCCGRPFSNRKKWRDQFETVKYCSKQCQVSRRPVKYIEKILDLVTNRGTEKSICPSEVLRPQDKTDQKKLERVRNAARILCHEKKIEILQKGRVVNPLNFKGPIRLRIKL